MKRVILSCLAVLLVVPVVALQARPELVEAGRAAECSLPVQPQKDAQTELNVPVFRTEKEAKKAFKIRRKQIKKLVKKYHKSAEAQKPAVKAELAAVVSEGMDLGLLRAKAHIAAQRANLDRWAAKLADEEKDFTAAKARRVDDLISGEAERKYKEAKKAWKKQLKEAQKEMH